MFTIKTWHLHVPSPISKHPNASIRETTSGNFRQMKCVMCPAKTSYYCGGCRSDNLEQLRAICCPFVNDRTCWQQHVSEMETSVIIVDE